MDVGCVTIAVNEQDVQRSATVRRSTFVSCDVTALGVSRATMVPDFSVLRLHTIPCVAGNAIVGRGYAIG